MCIRDIYSLHIDSNNRVIGTVPNIIFNSSLYRYMAKLKKKYNKCKSPSQKIGRKLKKTCKLAVCWKSLKCSTLAFSFRRLKKHQ